MSETIQYTHMHIQTSIIGDNSIDINTFLVLLLLDTYKLYCNFSHSISKINYQIIQCILRILPSLLWNQLNSFSVVMQ